MQPPPLVVAGPCTLESRSVALRTARELRRCCDRLDLEFVFKGSFDKANRSSGSSRRGPGLEAGLEILREVRQELGVRVLTDIHECHQAAAAADVVDVLQIPAFLCRQTDLLRAAGATGRTVNIKKGPFLPPWLAREALSKALDAGAADAWITERGTSFGHGDLVVDFRGLRELWATGRRVLFDAGHAAQRPGARGDRSGGERGVIPLLVGAAAGAGLDALYLEVHPDPDRAWSDPETQWPLDRVAPLLDRFARLVRAHRALPPLEAEHGGRGQQDPREGGRDLVLDQPYAEVEAQQHRER